MRNRVLCLASGALAAPIILASRPMRTARPEFAVTIITGITVPDTGQAVKGMAL